MVWPPAFKIDIPDKAIDVSIIKRTLLTTASNLIPAVITEEQPWRVPIIQKLTHSSATIVSVDLKDFKTVIVELYRRGSYGAMARTLSVVESREELQCCTNFHVEKMTLAFTVAYKEKDTTERR